MSVYLNDYPPPDLDGVLRYLHGLKRLVDIAHRHRRRAGLSHSRRLLRAAGWVKAEADRVRALPGVELDEYEVLMTEYRRLAAERWEDGRVRRFARARDALEQAAVELARAASSRRV